MDNRQHSQWNANLTNMFDIKVKWANLIKSTVSFINKIGIFSIDFLIWMKRAAKFIASTNIQA